MYTVHCCTQHKNVTTIKFMTDQYESIPILISHMHALKFEFNLNEYKEDLKIFWIESHGAQMPQQLGLSGCRRSSEHEIENSMRRSNAGASGK